MPGPREGIACTAWRSRHEAGSAGCALMRKQLFPEPTVGALIFNPNGEMLLVQSHKWLDFYVIPGGHIELGETMTDALIREVKEETGLDIYDIRFIGFQEFIMDDAFYQKRHFIFFDFSCKTHTTDVTLDSEAQNYIWITRNNLDTLQIEPYTRSTIEEYYKGV